MNAVFRDTRPADVVIVNSRHRRAAAWLERLRAAAYSDGLVATASTLSNHGTILSVPDRNRPVAAAAAGALDHRGRRAQSRGRRCGCTRASRPAIGHCLYIRRSALELVGHFDEAFSPGYGEEVDFSQRCSRAGCGTWWPTTSTSSTAARRRFGTLERAPERHERAQPPLPVLRPAVEGGGELGVDPARALAGGARLAIGELSVTLDGSCLGPTLTGTQVLALELVGRARAPRRRAPARHGAALDRRRPRRVLDALGVERMWHDEVDDDTVPTDDRPPALPGDDAAATCCCWGGSAGASCSPSRTRSPTTTPPTSTTTPSGAATAADADGLAFADRVLFFSPHARATRAARTSSTTSGRGLVPLGVDHRVVSPTTEPAAPRGRRGPRLPALPRHRLPAQEPAVRAAAVARSCARARLRRPARVRRAARRARHLGDEEAAWLPRTRRSPTTSSSSAVPTRPRRPGSTASTALVLYPTVYEGFGFIPYEAAEAGAPGCGPRSPRWPTCCRSSSRASSRWDVEATAVRAAELIARPGRAQVAAVREAAAQY